MFKVEHRNLSLAQRNKHRMHLQQLPMNSAMQVLHSDNDIPGAYVSGIDHWYGYALRLLFFFSYDHQTLDYILNHCSVFLFQGRHTWRHVSVLKHYYWTRTWLFILYKSHNPLEIFADLPVFSWFYGIPNDMLCTSQCPHFLLIFPENMFSCSTLLFLLYTILKPHLVVDLIDMLPLSRPQLIASLPPQRSYSWVGSRGFV